MYPYIVCTIVDLLITVPGVVPFRGASPPRRGWLPRPIALPGVRARARSANSLAPTDRARTVRAPTLRGDGDGLQGGLASREASRTPDLRQKFRIDKPLRQLDSNPKTNENSFSNFDLKGSMSPISGKPFLTI